MANTLNNLIPDAYTALDVVSRELVGFIPGASRNSTTDQAAKGQSVRSHQTRTNSAGEDIAATMSIPAASDQAVDNVAVTLTKFRAFPFSWTGEEAYAMDQGPGFLNIRQDQIAQAFRAAANEIEKDLADAAAAGASRAYGTAGTTPFASSLGDTAQVRKILDDNGAPASGRSLVIDTSSGAALRTLQHLTKVNESGSAMTLRDGELLNVHGFSIRESAQVNNAAAGTGSGFLINKSGGHTVGETELTVDTGTGTILAGDVLTIGSHKYVVASALSSNVVTIAAPGLRAAVADNATVTVNASSARNVAFTQDSLLLATRLPIVPAEGDQAIEREIITDPRSGLSFYLEVYPGYRMLRYQLAIAWGVKVVKPAHMALLLG